MADLSYLKSLKKPIAILGLGITGSAVAQACKDANIPCHVWDDRDDIRENFLQDGYDVVDFKDDLSDYDMLVPSAGIKPNHPVILKAQIETTIKSDIDLLYKSAPEATYIGITGTNGKSTTTALLGHILTSTKKKHAIGGNIGIAAASLPSFDHDGIYVIEASSYQLEITDLPIYDIAVCLNIAPDHLAWHGNMENYVAAKKKIFQTKENQKQTAILSTKDSFTKEMANNLMNSDDHDVIDIDSIALPSGLDNIPTLKGRHNQQNIAAAYAVCQNLGITDDQFINAVQSFPGLIHRQQFVDTINGVTFVNDSKATNAEAASKALSSFNNIHWIVGGEDKEDGLDTLDRFYKNIKHAYLIGVSSDRFANTLEGLIAYSKCETLDHAVKKAFQNANSGDVVLLAPACASFDQYKNFEQRGEHFITLVQKLKQRQAS